MIVCGICPPFMADKSAIQSGPAMRQQAGIFDNIENERVVENKKNNKICRLFCNFK